MRERIESKHVTKEIKSQMPVIPGAIVKERGCTFCPYYLGNYEKQPRCMMKTCAYPTSFFSYCPLSPHADTIPGMPPSPAPSSFWTDETAYLYPPGSPA